MAVNWTEGNLGIAQRTLARLDTNGDGTLSAKEAPGCECIDNNGTPGIQADELRAWLERADTYQPAIALDHLTWSWQNDTEELADLRSAEHGWRTATIATGTAGAALVLLGLVLLLTGIGAGAAVALLFGALSTVSCPIAGSEWADAHTASRQKTEEIEDHRACVASSLERVATAPHAQGTLGALTPPAR